MKHLAIALVAASLALAGQRPDFSGRWTTDPDPAAVGSGGARGGGAGGARANAGPPLVNGRGDMGSGWGSTITITQDAKMLTVEYVFFARGDLQPPLKFVYALDGSETKNSVMMGRGVQGQTSKASWDGDKFVIKTLHGFVDPGSGKPMTVEVTQSLSLESPTSLVVLTTRGAVFGGEATTTRSVYRKLQ